MALGWPGYPIPTLHLPAPTLHLLQRQPPPAADRSRRQPPPPLPDAGVRPPTLHPVRRRTARLPISRPDAPTNGAPVLPTRTRPGAPGRPSTHAPAVRARARRAPSPATNHSPQRATRPVRPKSRPPTLHLHRSRPRPRHATPRPPKSTPPTLYRPGDGEARRPARRPAPRAISLWSSPPRRPRLAGVAEIEAKDGLPSADRNNKATLLLTGPFRTAKSSAKDLTPLVLKLQYANYRGALRAPRRNRLLRR
ncbi:hypothetical protein HRG_010611 [Hirsutella rhossiliensis]|uniref:Uncharacterized protein n=1 Tax=Hirsutella rhossiliensis TaxID=111463 RepID=A0A9P8SEE4_9HYPO|nr:hypothetical protein HRG_10611 [Hirsutella rhossiliensis]